MLAKLTHWPSLLFVFILTACGGSEQGPYVTDIQANQLAYGKLSTFTLTGASLNKGVALSVTGCSNLKQDASSTDTSQIWTCFIDSVGAQTLKLTAKTATGVVLAEKSFDVAVPTSPVVLNIQSDRLMYSKTSQFTFVGQALNKDFNLTLKNCKSPAKVAGGSATVQTISCTVNGVGTDVVSVEAKLADGTALMSKTFTVPMPQVSMLTNLGSISLELNPTAAPNTASNFLQYVNDKFYDNTIIHRLVTSGIFVAQGGWLTPVPAVQAGQRTAISLEVGKGLSNLKGTIAMARSADLNSATSQFFFNLSDNTALDTANGGYAVFGKVISGTTVLDAISNVPTSTQYGLSDFPSQSVIVQSVIQTQ